MMKLLQCLKFLKLLSGIILQLDNNYKHSELKKWFSGLLLNNIDQFSHNFFIGSFKFPNKFCFIGKFAKIHINFYFILYPSPQILSNVTPFFNKDCSVCSYVTGINSSVLRFNRINFKSLNVISYKQTEFVFFMCVCFFF